MALILTGGCQPEETLGSDDPPALKLEGTMDPQFVGVWKSDDKASTYTLKEDGSYSLRSNRKTQQGAFEIKVDGGWRLNGEKLLFEDASKNVVPYDFKLEGKKLTLISSGTLKNRTVLQKE